jgi:Zn-finger nucleic acid-binding protein
MQQSEMDGRYGGRFVILYCTQCSGIWGNTETILQMNLEAAHNLPNPERLTEKLSQRSEVTLSCPACSQKMEEIEREGGPFSAKLHFRYCMNCESFWFDGKKQIIAFLAFWESKRRELKKREAERGRDKNQKTGSLLDILNLRNPFGPDMFDK